MNKKISYENLNKIRERGIVLASTNLHKLKEFQELFEPWDIRIHSLADCLAKPLEIEETGTSFLGNAKIKARAIFKATSKICLGDDSGLVIDALGGQPGIKSARYGGEIDYSQKCQLILEEMKSVGEFKKRSARFICALCLCLEDDEISIEENCEGMILNTIEGSKGFGYDPIFWDRFWQTSYGKLTNEKKNLSSHRARATRSLLNFF